MSVRTAERRRSRRRPASHAAAVYAADGTLVARGKTGNISENGVLLLTRAGRRMPGSGEVVVEVSIPDAGSKPNRRGRLRRVRFSGRIVRQAPVGHLVELGIAFDRRLD